MKYRHVCIEGLGYVLPPRVVTTDALEQRLAPVYERLGLPAGRLELMSGIRERRLWDEGTRPSQVAAEAGRRALTDAGVAPAEVGCLIHASVCRDYLEPATANLVHHALGLPPEALLFDLGNACLGVLDGMVLVADMIELGRIEAGLIVSGECAEGLLESTVAQLLGDPTLTRRSIKPSVASLTIGSAAAAVLLVRAERSRGGHRLEGGVARCATAHHALCTGTERAGRTLMSTDSEQLLAEGCRLAADTWAAGAREHGWSDATTERVFSHQVGTAHRRALLGALGVDADKDEPIYPWLGNTGSAALPVALARGVERGQLPAGARAVLLGIGSGINCLMLGVTGGTGR